jgi:hypothetical protein
MSLVEQLLPLLDDDDWQCSRHWGYFMVGILSIIMQYLDSWYAS